MGRADGSCDWKRICSIEPAACLRLAVHLCDLAALGFQAPHLPRLFLLRFATALLAVTPPTPRVHLPVAQPAPFLRQLLQRPTEQICHTSPVIGSILSHGTLCGALRGMAWHGMVCQMVRGVLHSVMHLVWYVAQHA